MPEPQTNKIQVSLTLPSDLALEIKLAAMAENITQAELIEEYLTTNRKMPRFELKSK